MASNNPNFKNIKRGKVKSDFFFNITDRYRLTKDNYQYILNERIVTKNNTITINNVAYYNSIGALLDDISNIIPVDIMSAFKLRMQGITQKFDNGRMICTIPNNIQFDKRIDA